MYILYTHIYAYYMCSCDLRTPMHASQGSKKKKGKATEANVDQKENVVEVAPVESVVAKQALETPVALAAAAPVVRPAPVAVPEGPGMKKFHWIGLDQ